MKKDFQRLLILLLSLLSMTFIGIAQAKERIRYYINDPSGSPAMVLDADGAVVARYVYNPFGTQLSSQPTSRQHLGFVGGIRETSNLHYLKHRYYNPVLGRFYQPDPVGYLGGGISQINRYGYGLNDPYSNADPNGLIAAPYQLPCADICGLVPDPNAVTGMYHSYTNTATERFIQSVQMYRQMELMTRANGSIMNAAIADALYQASTQIGRMFSRQISNSPVIAPSAVESGGLNLFKWGQNTTTQAGGWKPGDFMLYLPNMGSPRENWAQNSSRLRQEMGKGNPIFDSYRNPMTGERIPTNGFLRAERNLLESHGWRYDPKTGAYYPPSR